MIINATTVTTASAGFSRHQGIYRTSRAPDLPGDRGIPIHLVLRREFVVRQSGIRVRVLVSAANSGGGFPGDRRRDHTRFVDIDSARDSPGREYAAPISESRPGNDCD